MPAQGAGRPGTLARSSAGTQSSGPGQLEPSRRGYDSDSDADRCDVGSPTGILIVLLLYPIVILLYILISILKYPNVSPYTYP